MKAAILVELNRPLVLGDVELIGLTYGQVIVRVLVSGICGAQLQEIRGEKGNAKYLPHLLGHEGCGLVQSVGPGVSKVKAGDKVIMHWRRGSGIEAASPTYMEKGGFRVGAGKVTTLSEFAVVSENRITPVAPDVDPELCALLGCSLSTALATIENEAQLRMGQSILICGCGGLGSNLIKAARVAGAARVISCDIAEGKRMMAHNLGANTFYNMTDDRSGLTRERFDSIVETSGSRDAIEKTLPLLAPSGRFIMVGHPRPTDALHIAAADDLFEGEGKTIKATQGGGFMPDEDIPRYVALWRSRRLDISGIVTHRFPLNEINFALELVRAGGASRVVIDMRK